MARFPTFRPNFDYALQISVSDLKRLGYLRDKGRHIGSIRWGPEDQTAATINVTVDTSVTEPFVELSYTYWGEAFDYRVRLVNSPSNLGKGIVWYFVCPQTGKRCRILYGIDGRFLHRDAFPGGMYDCQTWSKNSRAMAALAAIAFQRPPSRTHYKGKETRRYRSWLSKTYKRDIRVKDSGLMEKLRS